MPLKVNYTQKNGCTCMYTRMKHFANALDIQIDYTTQQKSMNVCTNSGVNHELQMIQLHYSTARAATFLP